MSDHPTSATASAAPVEGQPLRARENPERHHPTTKQYVKIGIILALLTVVEVAVWYIDSLQSQLVTILLCLMTVKFLMVVLFFMHVRFDNPGYGRVFITGLALAVTVYGVVLIIFGVF
jgi:cytochrome c oxidase subunit 4